jgi:hypothetical protein
MVIGSDGVFEFLENAEVADIVRKYREKGDSG